jgi:internalin A
MQQAPDHALALIAREKQEKTGFLDLGDCRLAQVPAAVRALVWLETLNLGGFYIDLNGEFQYSDNGGGRNTLRQLPSWIGELKHLQALYLNGGIPIVDLSPLSALTRLQTLDCSNTQIADLSPLSALTELQTLDCSNTEITDLSPLLALTGLQELYCSSTQIADLSPLSILTGLQTLYCSYTPIADLSPISGLTKLQILSCAYTQIADLSPISTLKGLHTLFCSNTQTADLSPLRPKIQSGWPVLWDQEVYKGPGIYVQNCPLIIPPIEFAQESPEAVAEYFEELGEEGEALNEVKVIFLGEGEAGKTSLIKRLRGEGFDLHESQTHGIRIQKTPFALGDDSILAHCWDFGGQEVNHATHQFFLSQRCIYVVVLNSRSDDKAEKWLKHASSFGGRSPVLVVLNKIDEHPAFEVDRKRLREKYRNIQDFFRLSCRTGLGVEAFRQALAGQIEAAEARRTPFPAAWLKVKNYFAAMQADYIDSEQYRAVCEEQGVTRPLSQAVLLQFLHDLGLVINFRNLKNFDTQILNPLWLTNGVYRIINSERVAHQQGLLHEDDFDAVINDPRYDKPGEPKLRYPLHKLHYIVRVMQEFELCFQLDSKRYVVPQLLPVSEPDFPAQGKGLRFLIRFPELLPDSIFPRLMVKLHAFIQGDLRWRTGMVLHKPSLIDASAKVREDKEEREILIEVCGQEPRRLLSYIRETLKEIVAGFAHLPISEWVPIPGCVEVFDYEYLVEAEKAGEKEVFVQQLRKRVRVADLLDGVEEPAMRDAQAQTPVRAFVSYSRKDSAYLPQLRAAVSALMRLNKLVLWTDHEIDAGEEWRPKIFQQLDEAELVLCLVSADFIASDFCYTQELAAALAAHHKSEKTVVPIRLRECAWEELPLAQIQGLPSVWISAAPDKDAAWTAVAKNLEPAIQQAKTRKARRMS